MMTHLITEAPYQYGLTITSYAQWDTSQSLNFYVTIYFGTDTCDAKLCARNTFARVCLK